MPWPASLSQIPQAIHSISSFRLWPPARPIDIIAAPSTSDSPSLPIPFLLTVPGMSPSQNRLQVSGVAKSYPGVDQPLTVLRDVSFEMEGGQSAAIVGPSGCGKTTLLQIIGGLDAPDAGEVLLNGQNPYALDAKQRAAFRNRSIGFVFQDHHLLPQLSILENVLIPSLASGRPTAEQTAQAESLLDSVGLADRLDHLPSQLSGGQRERVAIARALLMKPTLILADEPTGNLDQRTAATITELLLRLQAETGTIFIAVTHSDALAEAMQTRYQLDDGLLVDTAG